VDLWLSAEREPNAVLPSNTLPHSPENAMTQSQVKAVRRRLRGRKKAKSVKAAFTVKATKGAKK
jgi:hypothetical protein